MGGNPININSTIANIGDVARIQNTEQHRDETQRQQFALTMQKESARKETQVQYSDKTDSIEIHTKPEKISEDRKRKRKKGQRKKSSKTNGSSFHQGEDDEQQHIDLKID